MLPLEIKKDIFWVGAVDFESRDFHGYSISTQGSSYNAYVIKDEKNVLFDTVKAAFLPTMVARLSKLMPPEKIDYIVVNHVELDHAGALPEIVKLCKPEKIFCSPMGENGLKTHFDTTGWPIEVKKTGESINIGKRNIHFIETRMLHWPDSMFSYVAEDKLLISNDAFGQNIASTERFVDEFDPALFEYATREYYHNIVLPYSDQVIKVLNQVAELKLEIDMIAPDHGLIFRKPEDIQNILTCYKNFAEQKTLKRAVIVYDTMWHSTEKMAYSIAEGVQEMGVSTKIMSLKHNTRTDVMTEVARCGLVIVGSPTHNNGILPTVEAMLGYMRGLRPKNRIGASFGSFGWSGECLQSIANYLTAMGMEQPVEGMRHRYVPVAKTLEHCEEMGRDLAKALISKCADMEE